MNYRGRVRVHVNRENLIQGLNVFHTLNIMAAMCFYLLKYALYILLFIDKHSVLPPLCFIKHKGGIK